MDVEDGPLQSVPPGEAAAVAARPGAKRPREDDDAGGGASSSSSSAAAAPAPAPAAAAPPIFLPAFGAAPLLMAGKKRGRPPASAAASAAAALDADGGDGDGAVDFSQPYAPGVLLHLPQVMDAARRIAAAFGALGRFEDDGDRAELAKLEAAVADVRGRLPAARAAAAARPDDAVAASLVNNTEGALRSLEGKLAEKRAAAASRFRRNVRESLLRVTLQKDASLINERPAPGAFGGSDGGADGGDSTGASSSIGGTSSLPGDVLFVQAPRTVCGNCGNADETLFMHEYRSGDVTCAACGVVAVEHALFDGDWTRSFEGEESSSQIGPRPDPLMSSAFNLRTGMALSAGVSKAKLRTLREFQDKADMLALGNDLNERRTREAFKDKQKQRCFDKLQDVGERLRIAIGVVDRSKMFFAAFRDNREHVTRLDEAVASCLIAAVEEAVYGRMQGEARGSSGAADGDGGAAGDEATAAAKPAGSPAASDAASGSSASAAAPAAATSSSSSTSAFAGSSAAGAPTVTETADERRARLRREAERRAADEHKRTKLHRVKVLEFDSTDRERGGGGESAASGGRKQGAGAGAGAGAGRSSGGTARLEFYGGDSNGEDGGEEEEDVSASKRGFERFTIISPTAVAAAAAAAAGGRGAGAGAGAGSSSASVRPGAGPMPSVSDDYVDALYARAAERLETNPDLEERDEYRAPS